MVNRSKIKGSAYEAKIRDLLTAELDIEFKRMPLSGALEYLKGDLWTPFDTAGWPYCIECKHELIIKNQIEIKCFEFYFKMGLLKDWIIEYKKGN